MERVYPDGLLSPKSYCSLQQKKARPLVFLVRTLVLRKVFKNMVEVGTRKFQANWGGPYVVTKAWDSEAYHLQTLDDVPLLHPWNISNLK